MCELTLDAVCSLKEISLCSFDGIIYCRVLLRNQEEIHAASAGLHRISNTMLTESHTRTRIQKRMLTNHMTVPKGTYTHQHVQLNQSSDSINQSHVLRSKTSPLECVWKTRLKKTEREEKLVDPLVLLLLAAVSSRQSSNINSTPGTDDMQM